MTSRHDRDDNSGHEQLPLSGQVAVVTGASRGIGEATARRLASAGATVALVARSADALNRLADDIASNNGHALAVPADIGTIDGLDDVVQILRNRFQHIDILINNAGYCPTPRRSETMALDDWQRTLDVNLTAPWYLATRVRLLMAAGSVVVNVASTAGHYPTVGLAPYNVSKAGLTMLTRALALEWAGAGIRVVGVAPGKTDTDIVAGILARAKAAGFDANPLGRIAQAGEIADLVMFLVSTGAGYITGSTHVIDGGELLNPMSRRSPTQQSTQEPQS